MTADSASTEHTPPTAAQIADSLYEETRARHSTHGSENDVWNLPFRTGYREGLDDLLMALAALPESPSAAPTTEAGS